MKVLLFLQLPLVRLGQGRLGWEAVDWSPQPLADLTVPGPTGAVPGPSSGVFDLATAVPGPASTVCILELDPSSSGGAGT